MSVQVLINKFSCANEVYKIAIIRWRIAGFFLGVVLTAGEGEDLLKGFFLSNGCVEFGWRLEIWCV